MQNTGRSARTAGDCAVRVENISKDYVGGAGTTRVLKGVTFTVDHGEFFSMMGPSGSGKSTLLYLVGGLTHATDGRIWLDGDELTGRADAAVTRMRYEKIGFVFQRFNLLPTLTALENVNIANRLTLFGNGDTGRDLPEPAELLEMVGLGGKLRHRPSEMSIGEQQRVAIARALVRRPAILLADEPTGSLDRANTGKVLDILCRLNEDHGQTIVMVTHDPAVARQGDRTLYMIDGQISEQGHQQ